MVWSGDLLSLDVYVIYGGMGVLCRKGDFTDGSGESTSIENLRYNTIFLVGLGYLSINV